MSVLVVDAWLAVGSDPQRGPLSADVVLDALSSVPSGDVLVVSGGPTATRAVQVATSGAPRADLATVHLSGPATRRHLIAYALRHLPPQGYGYADAIATAMDQVCTTRALLSSVARLVHPAPSLGDHVRSWLPGARFVLDDDASTVGRAPSNHLDLPEGVLAVVATGGDASTFRVGPLPGRVLAVAGPVGDGGWPSREWVEVTVAHRTVVEVVEHVLAGPRPPACPSCARPVTGADCRFCGIVVSPAEGWAHPGAHRPSRPREVLR